jgi:hypothetical protein
LCGNSEIITHHFINITFPFSIFSENVADYKYCSFYFVAEQCTAQDKVSKYYPGGSWFFIGDRFFCKEDGTVPPIPKGSLA